MQKSKVEPLEVKWYQKSDYDLDKKKVKHEKVRDVGSQFKELLSVWDKESCGWKRENCKWELAI